MNRWTQIVVIAVALGAMAAAQGTTPPVPPTPPQPHAPPKRPAAPAKSYLGIDMRQVTPERAQALKLTQPRGVEITLVDRDAPAGKAGLQEHDVILSFNGRNLQSSEELRKLIRQTPPGQTVELGISRDGQAMTIKAQLADQQQIVIKDRNIVIPHVHIPHIEVPMIATFARRHGVVVENLTPQLGDVFGVKNGEGVLVRSVDQGSPGEAAGIRAGDVIVRVGSEPVERTSDWSRALREQKPGPVPIGIVRDKRQQTLSLTVPEPTTEQSRVRGFRSGDWYDMQDFDVDMEPYVHSLEELNRVQPEIDRAMRQAQEKIQRELERSRRDAERARRQALRDFEQKQRDWEQAQRDFAQKQRDYAQKERDRAQREQDRAQREAGKEGQKQQEMQEQDRQKEPEKPQPPEKLPQ